MNLGKATGREFFNLCQKIKKMTQKQIEIKIEEEVIFIK
jgi:UDP-N-acetylenolpyruvoylglucosamine reductase